MRAVLLLAALGGLAAIPVAGSRFHPSPSGSEPMTPPHVRQDGSASPTGQVQIDASKWRIAATPDGSIRAEHAMGTDALAPYFDTVTLARTYGTTRAICGAFPAPTLGDDGFTRRWSYAISRPTTGACSVRGGGLYTAIGIKAGAEFPTAAVP